MTGSSTSIGIVFSLKHFDCDYAENSPSRKTDDFLKRGYYTPGAILKPKLLLKMIFL